MMQVTYLIALFLQHVAIHYLDNNITTILDILKVAYTKVC